jgi:CRP-like cAMP-binding protein
MLQFTERTTEAPLTAQFVRNKFLQSLSPYEFGQLKPDLTSVSLKKGAVVHEENRPVEAVYFIESGVVSRIARTQSDELVEIAMVGSSGFVGLSVVLGTSIALHRTIVLTPGEALRISAKRLLDIMGNVPSIRETLLRYAQILMTQNAHLSVCNARHNIESRLARWLLLAQDQLGDDTIPVTHDLLAMLLGVRRSGVSIVMQDFESRDILRKGRGTVTIRSRELLRQRSCECYGLVEEQSFWQEISVLHRHPFRAE